MNFESNFILPNLQPLYKNVSDFKEADFMELNTERFTSEHSVQDPALVELLAKDLWKKPKKNAAGNAATTSQ